ncbi:hypothetical protein DWV34_02960 [Anaerostipes sp. AF04-45]|nr:hypothetical protein DWV34_02960 [Anaerostipes sp. AF04-45]
MPHSNHVENGHNGYWKGILRIKWAIQCKIFYSLAFSRRNYVHFDQFGGNCIRKSYISETASRKTGQNVMTFSPLSQPVFNRPFTR